MIGSSRRGLLAARFPPARTVREIEPGEMVIIDADDVRSVRRFPAETVNPSLCLLEFVYLACPDGQLRGLASTVPGCVWASDSRLLRLPRRSTFSEITWLVNDTVAACA